MSQVGGNGNGNGTLAQPEIRQDGILLNVLTGLGDPEHDRGMSTTVGIAARLTKQQLEELACNWICNNIVSAYPHEATREWLEITLGGDETDRDIISGFDDYQDRLKIREKFELADYLANLYRGAAIVIVAEDGLDADKPLSLKNLRQIRRLEVLDCHKIMPELSGVGDPLDPEHYRLVVDPNRYPDLADIKTLVHHTRVLRFDGIRIPPDAMLCNIPGGWGASRLELVFDAFVDYESVHGSISEMANSFNVFKMGIKGLADSLKTAGGKGEEALRIRFRAIQKMMSVLKGLVVDSDKETVEFVSRNFAGIAEVMDRFTSRLVGASDLPYTVMFGRGPAGLAAQGTGDTEDAVWVKKVEQYQAKHYRPLFYRLAKMIWAANDGPTKGKMPEDWGFKFLPLSKEADQAKMLARSTAAQAYNTYVQMGALLPEEVRESQFGGSEYSIEITLDRELWDKKQQEQMGGYGDFGGSVDTGGDPNADPNAVAGQLPPDQVDPNADPNAQDQDPAQVQQQDSIRMDVEFGDEAIYRRAIADARSKFKIYPSAYASSFTLKRYKEIYRDSHGSLMGAFVPPKQRQDSLEQWFNEPWVEIGSDGSILGELDRLDSSSPYNGRSKPVLLPMSRAKAMSVQERRAVARRK